MENRKQKHKIQGSFLRQDLGFFALLAVVFIAVLIIAFVPPENKIEFVIMVAITFCSMLFAAYQFTVSAVILGGLQVTIYTAYKVFAYYKNGAEIVTLSYLWIIYPFISIAAVEFFVRQFKKLEQVNLKLNHQVDKLVLIDSLTGLYNLKSLYLDLRSQISLAERKGIDITLMIIKIRYESELNKILKQSEYDIVKQRIAKKIQELIRIEDRLYAIDEKGSLALVLACDKDGAEYVKRRIMVNVEAADLFYDIIKNKVIRIDLQYGWLQYDAEKYGNDMIAFKKSTERELQYDV